MANPLFDRLFGVHAGADTPFLLLEDGSTLTHSAFLERSAAFAAALAHLGCAPGDRVAVQIPKSPDALAVYAACAQLGCVFLPLNTAYTPPEVAYFLGDARARVFLCDPAEVTRLGEVVAKAGCNLESLGAIGDGSFADLAGGLEPRRKVTPRDADDLAALLYTSGTTGRSKGAMLSQKNLLSNAEVLTRAWAFTAQDVLLHALPIFHTHGLFVATNISLMAGGAMILLPRFDADAVMAQMPRATTMMGVPTFYTRLLERADLTPAATAHMRLFVSGSAPMLEETHTAWQARTGSRILERYGMTETNMSCSNPYSGERRIGTVGPALPGVEAKVCDAAGAELPRGEIGTLEVRGDNVFGGYWQMPEKTAEELRADGFFITGDLAVMDPDGYVTIVGRDKDLIIAGGFNIYPKEIEAMLDDMPGVMESAVVGAPHPDLGEGVVAVLARAPGQTPDIAAIKETLNGQLARFKQPRHFIVMDALPRNTMGKVQKAELRKEVSGAFS